VRNGMAVRVRSRNKEFQFEVAESQNAAVMPEAEPAAIAD
jgi:hypothetical protein